MFNLDHTYEERSLQSLEDDAKEFYNFLWSVVACPIFLYQYFIIKVSKDNPEYLEEIKINYQLF
jgi:hypothetical protein